MPRMLAKLSAVALLAGALAACEAIGEAATSTSTAMDSWFRSAKGTLTTSDQTGDDAQGYFARQMDELAAADAEAIDREGAKALDQGMAGKAVEWRNPATGVQAVFIPGDPVLEKRQVTATLKKGVARPVDLEVIGSTYESRYNSNLRSAPGMENRIVGRLAPGERFTAVGRSHGRGWILVAKGRDMVGYVYEPLVAPASSAGAAPAPELREVTAPPPDGEVKPAGDITFLAATPCRNLAYDVTTGKGQRARAELRACKAGDGAWEIN